MDLSTLKELITPEIIKDGVKLIAGTNSIKIIKNSKTFNNIWDITIGNRLDAWNQKSIFKNQQDVEKYKNECLEKISKISSNKIQDPKLSIIGPALEASKFYIEEEDIRNMFSNLIASSMDSTYNGLIQHSFVEIIKQLTPLDAKILTSFDDASPLVDFNLESNSVFYIQNSNFYFNNKVEESTLNSISVENLEKQGLISINKTYSMNGNKVYDHYYSSKRYKHLSTLKLSKNEKLSVHLGSINITNLGIAFRKVCC
ncbi:MAG: DUF4393 domain-containing protein [Cetobacterium sp.]|nr:DUF4393 domain-containing protein [Cetobacterium sp.]